MLLKDVSLWLLLSSLRPGLDTAAATSFSAYS